MTADLTDRQAREREEYDRRAQSEWRTDADLDHYSQSRFGPWNPYWCIWDFICSNFPDRSKLLSYGCGRGEEALRYANRGYQVSGFDISEELVRNARELAERHGLADRASFSVQAAESLDYQDDFFDAVVGENILHHINLPRAVSEMRRVLRPGGAAIFKDSLATPIRDAFRNAKPATWILPKGTKDLTRGLKYTPTEDERPLNRRDLALLREAFGNLEVRRFRVFATLATLTGNRPFWERVDHSLFRIAPLLRRFGDHVVLIMRKP